MCTKDIPSTTSIIDSSYENTAVIYELYQYKIKYTIAFCNTLKSELHFVAVEWTNFLI